MGGWGHEFGHTVANCSASAGTSCADDNPGDWPRPPLWTDYKRQVYGAHIENLASFLSAFLNEWKDTYNGGNGPFESDFLYKGYLNTADSFGAILADSAGGIDCSQCALDPTTCCPATHTCIEPTDESPRRQTGGGVCARNCAVPGASCAPFENRLTCAFPPAAPTVCWHSDYTNNWFSTVGTRLVLDSQWNEALSVFLAAQAGSSGDATRDFNLGTNSYYTAMADFGVNTLEVTRAVRSVTDEAGVVSRDDFTDVGARALPITVTDVNGTYIRWGSGTGSYPQINAATDVDYVMFRGLAGVSYSAVMQPVSSPALTPSVNIYRWTPAFTLMASATAAAGATATATTANLPATDWYVISFGGGSTSGRYTGRVKLATNTTDDYAATNADAYPLVTGVGQAGQLTSGDTDRFQIFLRTTTSLAVATTASPSPTVEIRNSAGTLLASGVGSATAPSAAAGTVYVDVRDTTSVARGYSVTATLGCAGTNCDDLTTMAATTVRNTWGDRFGGRLPVGASTATYMVTLAANENAVFSLADNSNTTCRLALDLTPPSDLTYFNGQPAFRWNDQLSDNGPAAGDRAGSRLGAGGHITAPIAGTYTLKVRRQNPSDTSACYYRLFIGRSTILGTPRPAW